MGALEQYLDALGNDALAAARPAAQAGAQVFYDQMKSNVRRLGKVSGNLDSAVYQAYSKRNSRKGVAVYHVSWNARKAPHGHLLENGFIQRYASYVGKDGKWYTAVRPAMRGKPAPNSRASQAVKDAYYVLRKGGPIQHPAKAFARNAAQRGADVQVAVEDVFVDALIRRSARREK
jgi:hypothetical protein